MKTTFIRSILLIGVVILIVGCPPVQQQDQRFTSARMNNYGRDALAGEVAPGVDEVRDGEAEGNDSRELVEPDVIRRVGDLLLVLNQYRGLTIVDLDTNALLSQTPTYGYPRDLYVVDSRAYVLVSYARDVKVEDDVIRVSYGSKLYVFNIEDPANVVQEGAFGFEGDLVDSRMVGDVIYAVCSDYSWYDCCVEGGVVSTEKANKSYGSTGAVSINVADPADIKIADTVSFEGYGNLIQATNFAIFVVANDYNTSQSLITYIDITDPAGDIVVRGSAAAPGYMADRFKMDAWNDALRVVTNTWWPDRQTYVTTFDISDPDTMAQLGQTSLESASGESLFATRFDGPLAYIVTYFTVDPLFVVDLSNPAAPTVVGELKIPGWSTHIEPRGDRLIALGVDDEDGRKVMVSLFDVSDPANPLRLDYTSFGEGWSWSSAYSDVKSLTVLDDMILVPFTGWNSGTGAGYDRLQFVSWNREDLKVEGYVDLQGSVVRSFEYWDKYYAVTQEQLAVINADAPAAPVIENSIVLAENVTDVVPLADDWVAEVIVRYDKGDTILRAKHYEDGEEGAPITLPVASVSDVLKWNDTVLLVAPVYEYEPAYKAYYKVYQVSFDNVDAPVISRQWTAAIEPWWGGWWYYRGGMEVDGIAADRMAYYPYYYGTGSSVMLAGDFLALRGYTAIYTDVLGSETVGQGLALIDLAAADSIRYVGLGYDNIQSIMAAENYLYLTSAQETGIPINEEEGESVEGEATVPEKSILFSDDRYCAYYMTRINPLNLAVTKSVNVPGILLGKVAGENNFVLQDTQYTRSWGTVNILRSISISGSEATLLDSVEFPEGYWNLILDTDTVYYAGTPYTGGYYDGVVVPMGGGIAVASHEVEAEEGVYTIGDYSLTDTGAFTEGQSRKVGADGCTLLGAKDKKVYVSVAGSVIATYDFNETPPELGDLVPTMSYPSKIRFGASAAYVPLGYSGVVVME